MYLYVFAYLDIHYAVERMLFLFMTPIQIYFQIKNASIFKFEVCCLYIARGGTRAL